MEAQKPEYFVDGYMLRHFGIWPDGVDKSGLFYEQKVFVIYLMGMIPSHDDWTIQVDYKTKLQAIKELTEKDIDISQGEIDLAELQGRNIKELKKERLISEKQKQIEELNQKFGIKSEKEEPKRPEGLPEYDKEKHDPKKELWEMLQGKGIVKENA